MSDDVEARLSRSLGTLAPAPEAEADLLKALEQAPRAPAPRGISPFARGLIASAALALLVVGGWKLFGRRDAAEGDPWALWTHNCRKWEKFAQGDALAPLDGKTLRVFVHADGKTILHDVGGTPVLEVNLGGGDSSAMEGADRLERAFVELTAGAPRDGHGESALAIEVVPARTARWRWIQWILQTGCVTGARLVNVRFGSPDAEAASLEQRLPRDVEIEASPDLASGPPSLEVSILPGLMQGDPPTRGPGGVTVRILGRKIPVALEDTAFRRGGEGVDLDAAMQTLTEEIRKAAADRKYSGGVIAVPRAGELELVGQVPYEIVPAIMRAFRAAGIEEIQFVGDAMPRAPRTKGQ